MIDTHAHLDFKDFDEDREEVILRFFEGGGKAIVNVGVDLERNRKSIEIARAHERVFASVGLHPDFFTKHEACSAKHNWAGELGDLAKNEKVVAIGETGLDYFRIAQDNSEEIKKNQKDGFVAQIEIAKELGLPVIVHCREAWEDLYKIIAASSKVGIPQGQTLTKFVLHCYSGNKNDTGRFLKLSNAYFSFSGNITYPKPAERARQFEEVIKMVSLDKIMLDSDAPFLAPQEFRGKRNEPAYVRHIAEKIAAIKQISGKEVERVTDKNARKFFDFG